MSEIREYFKRVLIASITLFMVTGCVTRTGTLYCDSRLMLYGPDILVNGTAMWGGNRHRDAFSTTIGSFMTLRLILFSWWWDTICVPYDVCQLFNGINIYVYDEEGRPIPGVSISAYHEKSLYEKDAETDDRGHFYFPRNITSFNRLEYRKEGYVNYSKADRWLCQNIGADQGMIREIEAKGGAKVSTTNTVHTLNIFMRKNRQ